MNQISLLFYTVISRNTLVCDDAWQQILGAVFDSSPKSSHDHPTPANTSSGSVKFSLDNTSTNEFSRNFDDIIVENGHAVDKESPIAPANQIRENHAGVPRLSPTYRTRRFQRESASRKRSNRQPRSEQVSKEKLRQTEEGENLRIAIQRGRTEEVRRILESGERTLPFCSGGLFIYMYMYLYLYKSLLCVLYMYMHIWTYFTLGYT